MGAEDNGLTLEGLAQRLEALERENTALRNEVVTALRGSGTRRDELAENRGSDTHLSGEAAALAFDGQVSRRSLLSKAGAAAVAAVAAGTLLNQGKAQANHYGPGIEVDYVWAHSDDRTAVGGISGPGPGGFFGVYGRAENADWAGVAGRHYEQGGIGVDGWAAFGIGVKGNGRNGVHGQSTETGWAGVYGNNTTSYGFGVVGDGKGDTGAGVLGRNPTGYGGQFEGGKAQLQLKPGGSTGKPTTGTHTKGEIYMDSAGTLFVCTADGSPGRWKQISATVV